MKFSISYDQAGHELLDMSDESLGIIVKHEIRRALASGSFNQEVTISPMKEETDDEDA